MRIGIDLGGTKIEAAILDDDGTIVHRERCQTPKEDYAGTIAAIVALVERFEDRIGHRCSVGVGMPGTISPHSGLVKNANSTWIIGQPLDEDLTTALQRPVRLANDANCFALSEAVDGAAAEARVVFGVILGTGVGGGVIVDRKPLVGAHAIAGEWGHNPLPWPEDQERPGPPCYCGKFGCIEAFLSGPAMARDHAAHGGQRLSTEAIAAQAAEGEPASAATLARYADRLARSLAVVINIVDPDAIVLGGGLSNIAWLYEAVPERLPAYVFSDVCTTPILQACHGDSSGVRGAGWLWQPDELDPALAQSQTRTQRP